MRFRPFELHRDVDVAGVSGEGVVARGQRFDEPWTVDLPNAGFVSLPAGWVLLHWLGEHRSVVLWESLEDAMAVHGHRGLTRLVWTDVV